MYPDLPAEKDYTSDSAIYHHLIVKDAVLGKSSNNIKNYPHSRQQDYIYRRMRVEPEQVLIQEDVSACRGVKEMCPDIFIKKEHGNCCSQHRDEDKL